MQHEDQQHQEAPAANGLSTGGIDIGTGSTTGALAGAVIGAAGGPLGLMTGALIGGAIGSITAYGRSRLDRGHQQRDEPQGGEVAEGTFDI